MFLPPPATRPPAPLLGSTTTTVALAVSLLGIGLVAGFVVFRRRPRRGTEAPTEPETRAPDGTEVPSEEPPTEEEAILSMVGRPTEVPTRAGRAHGPRLARRIRAPTGVAALVVLLLTLGASSVAAHFGSIGDSGRSPLSTPPAAGLPNAPEGPVPTSSELAPQWAIFESGLPNGVPWAVDVGGRNVSAVAPAPVLERAAPANSTGWTASAAAFSPDYRYVAGPPTTRVGASPAPFVTVVPFATMVRVDVRTVPPLNPTTTPPSDCGSRIYQWDNPCPQANYYVDPSPGESFVPLGSTLVLNATPLTITCAACGTNSWANLTFLSWTGDGNGSVNTTSNLTTVRVLGPLEETASFRDDGFCQEQSVPYSGVLCFPSNSTLTFVETGLPNGTRWSVTTWASDDPSIAATTSSATGARLSVSDVTVQSIADFRVWDVPGASPGSVWVPTTSPTGPVEIPQTTVVRVDFQLASSAGTGPFLAIVQASGLPNASTPWSVTIGGTTFGLPTATGVLPIPSGSISLNASPVVLANATAYQLVGIDAETLETGASWQNSTSVPSSLTVTGPTYMLLQFAPYFQLWVGASQGGVATPDGYRWVPPGVPNPITASNLPGFTFLGWSGTGLGAYSGSRASLNVSIYGPVSEVATFRPAAEPTHTLTLVGAGIPSTEPFTVLYNGTGYTGTGSVAIPPIPVPSPSTPSSILLAVSTGTSNETSFARFVPIAFALSGGPGEPENFSRFAVNWTGNASATVTFQEQFILQVAAVGPGNVTPVPGSAWYDAAARVALAGSAAPGARFVDWNGTGPGSDSGTGSSITVVVDGPVFETADFAERPVLVPGFPLTVSESGLPKGLTWSASTPLLGTVSSN
ncbi:MAG TPA: hypothetical protein VMH90_02500, partial [Thermoplasmata archaeon]|nr:hypothetical protein [Thermoplasmata archaeon]